MYQHFLILSICIRILSCEVYTNSRKMKSVVNDLIKQYLESYKDLYGIDSINNNVHDLCHVLNDIELFGSLKNISAYPFESTLYTIKNMLRSNSRPLEQASNRIIQMQSFLYYLYSDCSRYCNVLF